jgi:hypothetical protein
VKAAVLVVARSGFTLWAAFILAHLWLGLLNLYGPGYPMGDVTSVYKFWVDQLIVNDFQVGIDSQWVYPILAFVPMLASLAFGSALYGSTWLSIVMLLNVVGLGVLTDWGRRRDHNAAGWWWVAFLFLLGPIALGRIDAVTVPLALVGMLLLAHRPRVAALILVAATWVKIWPAALLAAIVISVQERFRIIAVAATASLFIIAVALLMGSGSNVLSFITQQTGRGLQIEAPISSIWLWMARTGVPNTFVYYDQAILTFQVEGPGASIAAMAMTPVLAVAVFCVGIVGVLAVRRGVAALQLLPPLALALVTAFIVFNKVGSPQFESWLMVPVVFGMVTALRGGRSFRVPAALVLVIAALTQAIYPYLYNYVLSVNYVMLIVLTSRNLLLIGLFAWALVAVIRLYRAARWHDAVHLDEAEPTSWPLSEPLDHALQENQPS